MMPNMALGVSRKVEDAGPSRQSRHPRRAQAAAGFGFIIAPRHRRTKTDLKRDLSYLQRLWKTIERRMKEVATGELFARATW